MRSNRSQWIIGSLAAATLVMGTAPAEAVRYCTNFNSGYLTRILTDTDDCASYSCGFYEHDFADAKEDCGDEVFRVPGPRDTPATCDFCFWSECFSVQQNEFLVVPLDEVGTSRRAPISARGCSMPPAPTRFSGAATTRRRITRR